MTVVISQRRARIRARRQRRNDGNEWLQEEELEHHNSAIWPKSTYSTYYQVRVCVDLYVSLQTKLPVCSVLLLAAGSKYLGPILTFCLNVPRMCKEIRYKIQPSSYRHIVIRHRVIVLGTCTSYVVVSYRRPRTK